MNEIAVAVAAAQAGASIVADGFGTKVTADFKGRNDPVTSVDRAAEAAIVDLLRDLQPGDGLLAEEGSGSATGGRRWVVDPLDGTVNYIHGIPHVAVSVALWEDDNPLVAVVIDPLRNETFTAEAGMGCRLNGDLIAVSGREGLSGAVVATGFPYDHDRYASGYAATVGAVLAEVNGLRRLGSAALDLAWVAAGRYDAYWEFSLSPWDVAAGVLLVQEASGRSTDVNGSPTTLEHGAIVAGTPGVHEPVRALVAANLPVHLQAATP